MIELADCKFERERERSIVLFQRQKKRILRQAKYEKLVGFGYRWC